MWLLAVTALCGCRPEPASTDTPSTAVPAPGPEPVVTWSELAPTVPWVAWEAEADARSTVEYGLDDAFDRVTPPVTGEAPAIAVLGLAAGLTWRARAVSERDGLRSVSEPFDLPVPSAPPGVPRLEVLQASAGAELPTGFVLGAVTNELAGPAARAFQVIWDGEGRPVWWSALEPGHISVSPSIGWAPGTIWWDDYDSNDTAFRATAVSMRLDGAARQELPLLDGHHGLLETSPGTLTWMARELREDPAGGWLTADRVLEASTADVASPIEVVDLYDAVFDGTFQDLCEHTGVPTRVGPASPVREWSHLNSMVALPDQDALLLNLRWVDTVVSVDRTTGAVNWRLGGPQSDFTLPDGSPLWAGATDSLLSHAHFSDAWDGGLIAFDNGTHRDPPVSAVVELAWDEASRTVEPMFRYEDPDGRFVGILGDARRMPGGGTLASWSTLGEITELSVDGDEEWRGRTDPLRSVSRVLFLPDLYAVGGR